MNGDRRWIWLSALCAMLWLGCDDQAGRGSPDASAAPTRDDPTTSDSTQDAGGQTGPIGASWECDPAQCAAQAVGDADYLSAPAPGSGRTFTSGRCELFGIVGVAKGMACTCEVPGGGTIEIGPEGAGCFAFGRAGDCLWDDGEYDACSAGAADPCDGLCGELQARYAADADKRFDAEVRSSECDASGMCHYVLRIGDACYADRSYLDGESFDCALPDDAILAQYQSAHEPEPTPPCGAAIGAQGGTCEEPAPGADAGP